MQQTISIMRLFLTLIFLFLNVSDNDAQENTLPNPLFEDGTKLFILTGESTLKTEEFKREEITAETIKKIDLKNARITVFFVHGFIDGPDSVLVRNISYAYKRMCKNCNVGIFLWQIQNNNYEETAKRMPSIGQNAANSVNTMMKFGLLNGPFSFVGVEMGAHFVAAMSKQINGEVLRIVGLDPPSKIFSDNKGPDRLSKDSAKVVHIVHTYLWTDPPSKQFFGHIDFYPNGGRVQPTCRNPRDEKCNRHLAVDYYVEAILKPDSILGVRCRDYGQFYSGLCSKDIASMGTLSPDGDSFVHGRYYMVTNKRGPPHGLGKRGLKPDWWPTKTGENEDKPGFFKRIWLFFKNIFG